MGSLSLLPGCICPYLMDLCRLSFVWLRGPLSSLWKGWRQLWDGALTSAAATVEVPADMGTHLCRSNRNGSHCG